MALISSKFLKLAVSLGACYLAAFVGSLFTTPKISTWYATLTLPSFAPPESIFAPVWTTLYTLMGISAYVIWLKYDKDHRVRRALALFAIQLAVNPFWSFAFFGYESPLTGLAVIAVLWALIVVTMYEFHKISKTAGILLLPYLLWVSFAMILNFAIWRLN